MTNDTNFKHTNMFNEVLRIKRNIERLKNSVEIYQNIIDEHMVTIVQCEQTIAEFTSIVNSYKQYLTSDEVDKLGY